MTRRLPEPIREALASDVDEQRVHALWTGTGAAVARRRYGRAPRAAWIASSVLAATACVALAWSSRPPPPAPAPVTTSLALADGSAPVAVDATHAPVRIAFADGSTVEATRGTRLAPVANDASQLALSLEAGRVEVHVTPGGPRRWRIECGPVVVEVIGTVFTVERTSELVRVAVERGVVTVRGAPVPDGERTLRAGDSIAVPLVSPVVAAEPTPVEPPATVPPAQAPRRARPTPADDDAWRALADRGDHDAAYEALHATGIAARSSDASARELLLLADVARLSGHPADAVLPLERLLEEHPDDAEAPLAAIILARIERDRGRAARAADIYQRALALGVPSSLAATIHGERVDALRRAGDVAGCEDAVRGYLAAHPEDPRATDVGTCSPER